MHCIYGDILSALHDRGWTCQKSSNSFPNAASCKFYRWKLLCIMSDTLPPIILFSLDIVKLYCQSDWLSVKADNKLFLP